MAALGLWLASTQVDVASLPGHLARTPVWALAGATSLLAVNLVLYAVRWRVLLRAAGSDVPARALLPAILLASGANAVLPGRAGDLLRVESARERFGVRPAHALGTLFLERLLDGVALSVLLVVAALALHLPPAALAGAFVLLVLVALGVVLTLLAARRPARAARLLTRATGRLPARVRPAVERSVTGFLAGLGAFADRRALARAVLLSFLMWPPEIAMFAVMGHGLGLELPLASYVAIGALANIALSLPLTPAGLGTYDAAVVLGAAGMGGPAGAGAVGAYVVAMRGVCFVPVMAAAAAMLPKSLPGLFGRRSGRPMTAARRPVAASVPSHAPAPAGPLDAVA